MAAIAAIAKTCYNRDVYEPAEDSFLLVDVVAQDRQVLQKLNPSLCVEVGCGSGYVITSLALLLRNAGIHAHHMAVDITSAAVAATTTTARDHQVSIDVIQCDLLGPLLPRLHGAVDVLLFNPPYVPTPDEEVARGGIAAAWAGGNRGRMVTDRLLPAVSKVLSAKGVLYLVTVPENDPQEIAGLLQQQGLVGRCMCTRQADEEVLSVWRFSAGG